MADQQIATALTNIANVLAALQANQAGNATAPPTLQLYDASTPFNLYTRIGSSAWEKACAPLDVKWDGTIDKLPAFIIALKTRGLAAKWNAPAPNGVLSYSVPSTIAGAPAIDRSILTEYHSIPMNVITDAATARTDDRAIQNARAFFCCLRDSIEGDLKEIVFEQDANMPTTEDGGTLLKTLTEFSMASSLQLTIQAVQDIHTLEPADFAYKVTAINTRLIHLFMLAASVNRTLSEPEKIMHTLTVYKKIKQPEAWAEWIRARVRDYDNGTLLLCQPLMNEGQRTQTRIVTDSGGDFHGRSTTMRDDVIAMMAKSTKRAPLPTKDDNKARGKKPDSVPTGIDSSGNKLPPFVRFFKAPIAEGGKKYTIGDVKQHGEKTWYYCGCPTHRDNIKWHTHAPSSCRVRAAWLAQQGQPADATGAPAVHDDDTAATDTSTLSGSIPSSGGGDVMALLASVLSAVGDTNPLVKDLVADALSAAQDDVQDSI
jgi:hypothetical protein